MIELRIAHKKFIEHLEENGRAGSTLIAYGKDIEQLVDFLERNGLGKVSEIELNHLESFMSKLSTEDYTPKSISRKTNSTKTFFKYLHEREYIVENVADRLKHPKVQTKAPRILSKLEYRALRDASKDDLRSFAIIETMLQTGITISELSEMKMADLDLENEPGNLFIPAKNNKRARNIPLNKAVKEAIKEYFEKDRPKIDGADHVFVTKTGNPLLVRNIRSTIQRFYDLAGVENAKVNDLRHTFVAHHLASGTSLIQVSKVAGHLRISTTERYLQYIEKAVEEEKTELDVL